MPTPTIHITCSEEFTLLCPDFRVGVIEMTINPKAPSPQLESSISETIEWVRRSYDLASWRERSTIAATRRAYKRCGKDPNRYRPAADQLGRRIINALGLYRVHAVVDWGNLLSLRSGYSMGLFDRGHISGESVELRLGRASDEYEGIGRGLLNIDRMPVYCDALGPFATPTSDSLRTCLGEQSEEILIFVNDFTGQPSRLEETLEEVHLSADRHFEVKAYSSTIVCPGERDTHY